MAYLDRDPTKTLVYLGGALKNPRIPEIGNALRRIGLDAMDEWWTPGEHADTNWQAYEGLRGRSYKEALRGRAATNTFLFDKAYIDLCDVFVLVMPAGKSSMLELGYAAGLGKQTILFLDGVEPERYDIMPNAAYKVLNTLEELINELRRE
jgi:nucleoside 2-deoxyribosyltransferase